MRCGVEGFELAVLVARDEDLALKLCCCCLVVVRVFSLERIGSYPTINDRCCMFYWAPESQGHGFIGS